MQSSIALVPVSFLAATDLLAAALMMVPVWLVLRKPRLTAWTWALAGVAGGAAYLVKTSGLFVLAGLLAVALGLHPDRVPFRRRILHAASLALGAALATAPWLCWSWHARGSPLSSDSYLQIGAHFFLSEHDSFSTTRKQAALLFTSLWDVVRHNPSAMARRYLNDVVFVNSARVLEMGVRFPASLFVGAGFLLYLARRSRARAAFLAVNAAVYLCLSLVDFQVRFYFFLFPWLFLLAAMAIFEVTERLGARGRLMPAGGWIAVGVVGAYLAVGAAREVRAALASEPRYYREAAEALRRHAAPGDLLIDPQPHLAYLSGLQSKFPLAHTAQEYVQRARELGARYVVYNDREVPFWPALQSLADPAAVPAELVLIYERAEPTRLLIYEVRDGEADGDMAGRRDD